MFLNCIYSARSEYLKPVRTQELVPDEYFPQEMGVVAIRGTDAAVSISKVLMGLFVGLKPDRKTELTSYESVQNLQIPPDQLPQDTIVDALFAVTMAGKNYNLYKTFFFAFIHGNAFGLNSSLKGNWQINHFSLRFSECNLGLWL